MSYLDSLVEAKQAREKYEEGVQKLKEIVVEIEEMHNLHNGDFLSDLQEFINNYKKRKK